MDGTQASPVPQKVAGLVADFKDRYRHVYAIQVDSKHTIIFRALTWREFFRLESVRGADPLSLTDEVLSTAVLWPETFPEDISPGGLDQAAGKIVDASGFGPVEALKEGREWGREQLEAQIEHKVVVFICKAFPSYKPEDIYEMPFLDLMVRLAQAEDALQIPLVLFQEDLDALEGARENGGRARNWQGQRIPAQPHDQQSEVFESPELEHQMGSISRG